MFGANRVSYLDANLEPTAYLFRIDSFLDGNGFSGAGQNMPLTGRGHICVLFSNLLAKSPLSTPETRILDCSKAICSHIYMIASDLGGSKLFRLRQDATDDDRVRLYGDIGRIYRTIHSPEGERAGLIRSASASYDTKIGSDRGIRHRCAAPERKRGPQRTARSCVPVGKAEELFR